MNIQIEVCVHLLIDVNERSSSSRANKNRLERKKRSVFGLELGSVLGGDCVWVLFVCLMCFRDKLECS